MKIISYNVNNWGGFIAKPLIKDYSANGYHNWQDWNTAVDSWRKGNSKTIQNNVQETVTMIKGYDIVFLHEVDTNCDSWELLKQKLSSDYRLEIPNGYKITELSKGRKSISCAFIKKGFKYSIDSYNYSKKLRNIQIKIADVCIVGVHVPINKKYWDSLHNVEAHIILGDFNTGDYDRAEKRKNYVDLLREYCDICGGAVTTKYNTPIDHILVLNEYKDKCLNPIVHYDIKLSDHYPISFEMVID